MAKFLPRVAAALQNLSLPGKIWEISAKIDVDNGQQLISIVSQIKNETRKDLEKPKQFKATRLWNFYHSIVFFSFFP